MLVPKGQKTLPIRMSTAGMRVSSESRHSWRVPQCFLILGNHQQPSNPAFTACFALCCHIAVSRPTRALAESAAAPHRWPGVGAHAERHTCVQPLWRGRCRPWGQRVDVQAFGQSMYDSETNGLTCSLGPGALWPNSFWHMGEELGSACRQRRPFRAPSSTKVLQERLPQA